MEDGAECSPEGACPPGQTCAIDGRCYREAPAFRYRRRIDIHPVTVSNVLRDFPMAVVLRGDEGLAAHAAEDGLDIHFTDAEDANELAFEVEEFDPDAGDLVAWVRVPALSFDGAMHLHYGGDPFERPPPAEVWHERYLAVWHAGDTGEPAVLADSTANQNQGASGDERAPARVDGVVGPALSFDGVDDEVLIDEKVPLVALDPEVDLLVTMWVYVTDAIGESDAAMGKGTQSGSEPGFGVQLGVAEWMVRLRASAAVSDSLFAIFGDATALTGRWVMLGIGINHSGGGVVTFPVVASVDGEDVGLGYWRCSSEPCIYDLGGPLYLGHPEARFEGLIDEIRVVDRNVAGENQRAEFENLANPESFYTVAGEETLSP